MNRNTHISMILTSVTTMLAGVALAACDGPSPDDRETAPQTEVTDTIAAVTLADGSQFRFYEPVPGEIVVAAVSKSNESLARMEMLDAEQPSALALYRALTDTQAPAALIDAHARAEAARKQGALDFAEGRLQVPTSPANDVTQVSSAITSAEFKDKYCKSSSDWDYVACLLNYNAPFTADQVGMSLGCRVQPQTGKAVMIHQTFYPFSWSSTTFTLEPQQIGYVRTYGFFTQRRCSVLPLLDSAGKMVRSDFSAWGDII